MEDDLPDDPEVLKDKIVRLQEELEHKNKQLAEIEELTLEMEQKLDQANERLVGTTEELSDVLGILESMRHGVQDFEQEYLSDDSDYGGVDVSPLRNLNNKDKS